MKSKLYICISILLTCFLFSCEQETTEILQPEQRVTSKIEATHADHYDLTKALIFFDSNAKKSLTTSLEGGDYLETAFGTAFLGKALKVSDGTNEGVLTFKILPKDYEENTFYNLVLYPEDTNGGQKAFIYKYVRNTSSLSYEEQKEKGFVGQRFKYPFDASLIDIKGGDCPPDDVDIPDPIGDTGNDGDGNNGGGGSNTGGGTTGDGGTNTSGAQICITMTTFVQCCGSNRFTPHAAGQCGCASNPTGSYYVTIIECSGGDNNRNSKSGCGGSDGNPIGVDDIPLHQLALLELLKPYIGSTEIAWIKDFNNDSITRKIFDYTRDNNFSTRSKETAAKIVKILSGVNSINIFTQKHEFKSFMGIISDRIGRRPIGYNHPEMGQRLDRLNLSEALAQADLDILSIEDWRIMAQNALTLRHNLQYWDGNDARMKEIVKSASTIVLLPHVKTLTQNDSFFPQTAEEWRALGELMTPFLIEIGLSAIPGSDIIDVVQGIQNNDYVAVTLGLAGLTTDLFGARLIRVIAKFGESAYKTFKIIRSIGRYLNQVGDFIRRGFKFDFVNGRVSLRKCVTRSNDCPLIASGGDVAKYLSVAKKLEDYPRTKKMFEHLTDTDLVKRMDNLAADQLEKLESLMQNQLKPQGYNHQFNFTASRNINGQQVSVHYGEHGFPNFMPHASSRNHIFRSNSLTGHTTDMTEANSWIINKFGSTNFRRAGSAIDIKIDGEWVRHTWHHHEDGRSMILVPSLIHNNVQGFRHSGGAAIINRGLQDLFKGP